MDASVQAWIDALPAGRQAEARALVALFSDETGFAPRMWGAMVGFGRYGYVYDSGRRGESFPAGFAVRGREIALYVLTDDGAAGGAAGLAGLGPHRAGKGCLYIRSLAAVDESVLRAVVRARVDAVAARWGVLSA